MDAETQRYVDLKTEATRAQNDTRFVEVLTRLDKMPSIWSVGVMFVVSVVSIVGAVLAFLTFGGDRFDGGVGYAANSVQQAVEAREISQDNAARMDELDTKVEAVDRKLDVIIEIIRNETNQ